MPDVQRRSGRQPRHGRLPDRDLCRRRLNETFRDAGYDTSRRVTRIVGSTGLANPQPLLDLTCGYSLGGADTSLIQTVTDRSTGQPVVKTSAYEVANQLTSLVSRLNETVRRAATMCCDKAQNMTTCTLSVTVPSCTGIAVTRTHNGSNLLTTLSGSSATTNVSGRLAYDLAGLETTAPALAGGVQRSNETSSERNPDLTVNGTGNSYAGTDRADRLSRGNRTFATATWACHGVGPGRRGRRSHLRDPGTRRCAAVAADPAGVTSRHPITRLLQHRGW